MEAFSNIKEFELICLIVKDGLGSKVTKIAKQNGITGATVFLGRGTIKNFILELLDLTDVRKEIVLLISDKNTAYKALEVLNRELELHKPNHGIAFVFSLSGFYGARDCNSNVNESRGVENTMYKAIFTVVEKGMAEAVVDAATSAGSAGATIINARGAGLHETHMLFSMAIEPEKEVVMILSESGIADSIVTEIRTQVKIDEPGKGLIFVLDVNKAYGLFEK
jgi:nitrogen regulatory protein PII